MYTKNCTNTHERILFWPLLLKATKKDILKIKHIKEIFVVSKTGQYNKSTNLIDAVLLVKCLEGVFLGKAESRAIENKSLNLLFQNAFYGLDLWVNAEIRFQMEGGELRDQLEGEPLLLLLLVVLLLLLL